MEYAVKGGTFDSVFYFEWSLSYSSIVPRREDSKRRTLTLNLQLASKWERKAAANGFPTASSTPNFQQKHPETDIPHYIEGAPQNVRTGVGYASHRGVVINKNYNPAKNITKQLRTSENSWEHRKTPKIIWYHPENNWGPLIDNLVQFEEDFNSGTKMSVGWSPVGIGYVRPVQFLDHLTVIKMLLWGYTPLLLMEKICRKVFDRNW